MKTVDSKFKINIAATPIGNIQEVSTRFLQAVEEMDILLCEDTRVIKKLLMLLNINKKFTYLKFDMFSELTSTDKIITEIQSGKQIMLLSDAGYPTISDPGYKLVEQCIKHNIAINVINGPCSLIHALVGSGFSSREFFFLGFIGKTKTERLKKLNEYKHIHTTMIILESVHRLQQCLEDLYHVLGAQNVCIARELSKLHEEFIYCNLSSFNDVKLEYKGEFVIVVDNKNYSNTAIDDEVINQEIIYLLNQGIKTKDISLTIANKYNVDAKTWYSKIIELKAKIKEK